MARSTRRLSWRHDLKVYWYCLRLQARSALSLRAAFIVQMFGVVLYNMGMIAAWLFLFHSFGTINGWGMREFIGASGITMFVFGLVMLLSVGILDLPRHVDRGSLDSMLTKPSPILLQLAGNTIDVTSFVDIALGLSLGLWYLATTPVHVIQLAVFIVALLVAMVLFWCFAIVLPSLLSFYIYDSERLSRYAGFLIMDSSSSPTGILTGRLRTFFLLVVPGLFVGAVPLKVLSDFNWKTACAGIVVAAFWLGLSLWLFHRSMRRYESSNLVGAR